MSDLFPFLSFAVLCASSQLWRMMLIQTLPSSPVYYTGQYSTFTAIVNNTMHCYYSANTLFFITDLLGHHDIPSFLPPPTSPPAHPSYYKAGAAQLCHMCNKCASQYFAHACTPGHMLYVTAVNTGLSIDFFCLVSKNIPCIYFKYHNSVALCACVMK